MSKVARRPAQAKCHWGVQPRPAQAKAAGWVPSHPAEAKTAEAAASLCFMVAQVPHLGCSARWDGLQRSLFPPSSKGIRGAACMRARAEVFERNIYSAAPHAAQRRRHARGACKGQVQKSRARNRRSAPPARLRTPRSRRLAPPAHRTGQGRPRKVRSRACFDCTRAPR